MTPKKHHFVPQMHLRFFSVEGRGKQIYCYDKEHDAIRCVAVGDAAAQSGYYEVPTESGPSAELELKLAEIEGIAHKALERLRHVQPPPLGPLQLRLVGGDREWLAGYVALQHLRVPAQRERFQATWNLMGTIQADIALRNREVLARNLGVEALDEKAERMRREGLKALEQGRIKVTSGQSTSLAGMLETVGHVEDLIVKMRWSVIKRFEPPYFLISDNPVLLYPPEGHSPLMGIGFATPGVELTMPVDPMTLLGATNGDVREWVMPAQTADMVFEANRKLWRHATRFIYGPSKVELAAVAERLSPEDRRMRLPTVDVASPGSRDWRRYIERAKERPARLKRRAAGGPSTARRSPTRTP